jgi:dihydrofolate reductase
MLSMIAAMGRNRVIGSQGQLPWKLRDDLRLFRENTTGHAVVMGRKTWDTLDKPLPNRTNIVLTRQPDLDVPTGVHVVRELDQALALCAEDSEPFIVGGGQVYRLFLPHATRIHLSIVDLEPPGDATFPELDESWVTVHEQRFEQNDRNEASFLYTILERQRASASPAR